MPDEELREGRGVLIKRESDVLDGCILHEQAAGGVARRLRALRHRHSRRRVSCNSTAPLDRRLQTAQSALSLTLGHERTEPA